MPLPYDLCVRLQNAFHARYRLMAVIHSAQNLGIFSILLCAGFPNNITHGTITSLSSSDFELVGEAQRWIWAEIKYRRIKPVLPHM
ncbi:hypothetical protein EDD16DRAFT_1431966, partial [Pisolithus croceorrhizus]